jgi:flagellar biosynthesis GTPase FlhF
MMKQFLKTVSAAAFFSLSVCAFSQSPDEPEIRSVSGQDVDFVNYSGPHAVVNTAAEITGIGTGLGNPVREGSSSSGSAARYQILHIIDPSVPDGFDADILILGTGAGVDHIRNLRRIIAGYLASAYGYTSDDASTLATFVTVYNAVYRGRMDYFTSKYKTAVTSNLTQSRVGLSLNYTQWPGATQIVIPISDPRGGLSSVDTSAITDKNVIESLRSEDDKGIEDRKDMVDLKEREADQLQEKADEALARAQDEEQKARQAQAEAEQARRDADRAQAEAAANPDDKEAQAKAEEASLIAEQKETEAERQTQVAEEEAQKADEAQAAADQKRGEAQEERRAIAQDQGELIQQGQDALSQASGVYGLKLLDDKGLLSSVVRVSSQNGQTLKESPVRPVRSRTMFPVSDGIVAIAGENTKGGVVKLVVLDFSNMEIIRESTEIVADNSVLASDGASFYAVIRDGSNWVLAKYNDRLELQQKSALGVNPATPVVMTASGIIVTGSDGVTKLLKLADLTEVN